MVLSKGLREVRQGHLWGEEVRIRQEGLGTGIRFCAGLQEFGDSGSGHGDGMRVQG